MVRVLVVEDDFATRLLFSAVLRRQGIDCTALADGNDALSALARDPYDAVLLDLVLPGVSGFDVLLEIKRSQPELTGRVVVCSALSERELRREPLLQDVAKVLRKPPDIDELAAVIVKTASRVHA